MKSLLILPAVAILLLGVAIELEGIAQSTSDKAIEFAGDMESAMDCATVGRPIRECSPRLMDTDFTTDVNETISTLENLELLLQNETIITMEEFEHLLQNITIQ